MTKYFAKSEFKKKHTDQIIPWLIIFFFSFIIEAEKSASHVVGQESNSTAKPLGAEEESKIKKLEKLIKKRLWNNNIDLKNCHSMDKIRKKGNLRNLHYLICLKA